MSFESDIILCKLAIDQKWLTEKEFYTCLRQYQEKKESVSLIEIAQEQDFLSKTQTATLLKMRFEQNYHSLVSGYQILSLLGQGGMGCVYRAIQTSMEREVALKILPGALAKDQDFISRFIKEAKLTGRLNHVNLITGYDVGEDRGVYFFAMELVNGVTLDRYLKENQKPLAENKAVDIILQISRALECAYEYKIIHRDIKPENILITPKGVAKLADMGLAKISATASTLDKGKTERGVIVGTPWYLAPEQAKGEEEIDCRADIYSLGITLYQLLTNEVPFDGDSIAVVMTKHIIEELPSVREKNPKVSQGVVEILKKMTAKEPKDRYQTPSELIIALELYQRPAPSASADITSILNLEVLEPPKSSLPPRSSTIEKNRFHFCYVPSEEDIWFAKIAIKNKVLNPIQLKKALDFQEQQSELGLPDSLAFFLQDQDLITFKQQKIMTEVLEKILWKEKQSGFERLLLKYGYIQEALLKKVMAHLEQNRKMGLLDFLESKALIKPEQKKQITLEEQKVSNAKIDGFLSTALVDCKFCKYEQIEEALLQQQKMFTQHKTVKSIGTLLIEKGFLFKDQLEALLRAYRRKEVTQQSITEILDEKRKLTVDDLSAKPSKGKSEGLFENKGLFDSIKFSSARQDHCIYCEAELVFGATRCRECGKPAK